MDVVFMMERKYTKHQREWTLNNDSEDEDLFDSTKYDSIF